MVFIIKIVVVENEAHREAFDDECRQVLATATPLLFGVFLDEFLEYVPAHKYERLFFEVRGFTTVQGGERFSLLFLDFRLCFCRGQSTPHLVEGVHVERQVVKFPLVVGDGAVRVAVEFHDGIHEVPHLLVAGMEDVRSVLVYVDPLDVFAIDIAAKLCALVYDEAFFPGTCGAVCKCGTEKT